MNPFILYSDYHLRPRLLIIAHLTTVRYVSANSVQSFCVRLRMKIYDEYQSARYVIGLPGMPPFSVCAFLACTPFTSLSSRNAIIRTVVYAIHASMTHKFVTAEHTSASQTHHNTSCPLPRTTPRPKNCLLYSPAYEPQNQYGK